MKTIELLTLDRHLISRNLGQNERPVDDIHETQRKLDISYILQPPQVLAIYIKFNLLIK